jgi:hypothetical protein
MKEYKYYLKRDVLKSSGIVVELKEKNYDIIVIELFQNYTNAKLKYLTENVINKVFGDVLNIIDGIISSTKNSVKRVSYTLEMEETNIPSIDMVAFRFIIIGESLGGLVNKLQEQIETYIYNEIGGDMELHHNRNQSKVELMTELMPIRSLKSPYPPKEKTLRKYYSDALYRILLEPMKIHFFKK